MCKLEDEDIIHFLLKCPLLAGSIQEPFRRLKNEVINNSEDGTWSVRIFNNEERITTLIIDCRYYSETFMEIASVMDRIEELSIELCYSLFQGRIQDFKLGGGAHLKKLRRAEGGAKMCGVFRVKNHDFMPKNLIFSNFRGGRPPPPWIRPCIC
jgi:hypothetical protein